VKPSEATKLAAMLKSAFPRQVIESDTLALYAAFLSDLDRERGEAAVRTAIATLKFFPSVAELRDLAARKAVDLPDETAAWSEVMRAVGSVGRYGNPAFSHAAIARVVAAIGWLTICDSDNVEATRAHFLRLFRDASETAVREANVKPMLEAAAERRMLSRSGDVVPIASALKRLTDGSGG